MNKNLSVHLQDFPDISFLSDEKELVRDMDMVRDICAATLFIRDKQNLRVRLPLNKLTIIGKNAARMEAFKDIIAEEVNVKKIEISPEIGDLAELKLQINFKKVGAKFGSKMKEISAAARDGKWQKIDEKKIEIAGEILENDEFEIKLLAKNEGAIAALPSNDCLIELDIVVTKELEEEGIARDIIRTIQQNRKDANLNISDRIKIKIYLQNSQFINVIKSHQNYICEQTLTTQIEICPSKESLISSQHQFDNKIEETELNLGIDLAN